MIWPGLQKSTPWRPPRPVVTQWINPNKKKSVLSLISAHCPVVSAGLWERLAIFLSNPDHPVPSDHPVLSQCPNGEGAVQSGSAPCTAPQCQVPCWILLTWTCRRPAQLPHPTHPTSAPTPFTTIISAHLRDCSPARAINPSAISHWF